MIEENNKHCLPLNFLWKCTKIEGWSYIGVGVRGYLREGQQWLDQALKESEDVSVLPLLALTKICYTFLSRSHRWFYCELGCSSVSMLPRLAFRLLSDISSVFMYT